MASSVLDLAPLPCAILRIKALQSLYCFARAQETRGPGPDLDSGPCGEAGRWHLMTQLTSLDFLLAPICHNSQNWNILMAPWYDMIVSSTKNGIPSSIPNFKESRGIKVFKLVVGTNFEVDVKHFRRSKQNTCQKAFILLKKNYLCKIPDTLWYIVRLRGGGDLWQIPWYWHMRPDVSLSSVSVMYTQTLITSH